jgi:hypothetical protein
MPCAYFQLSMVRCFSAGTACLSLKSTGFFVCPLAVSALQGMWPLARIPSEKFPHRQVFVAQIKIWIAPSQPHAYQK